MARLTPKGLSVRSRQRAISLVRSSGVGWVSAVMKPSAPALATADTSSARPTHCMPPWVIGWRTPNNSVKRVRSMSDSHPHAETLGGACLEGNDLRPHVLALDAAADQPRLNRLEAVEPSGDQRPAAGHRQPQPQQMAAQRRVLVID